MKDCSRACCVAASDGCSEWMYVSSAVSAAGSSLGSVDVSLAAMSPVGSDGSSGNTGAAADVLDECE